MFVETLKYTHEEGWSTEAFPDLDSKNTLLVVFAAEEFGRNFEPLAELLRAYPQSKVIGCSTAGEVYGTECFDAGISVAITRFDQTQVRFVSVSYDAIGDTYDAAKKLTDALQAPDLKGVFVLSDGLVIYGKLLAKALTEFLPGHVAVGGGLAADAGRFERTWVLDQGQAKSQTITAIGFYGDNVRAFSGAYGGYGIVSEPKIITRARGNILYELDGESALDVYLREFGVEVDTLTQEALLYPLGIREDPNDERTLVRLMMAVDEANRATLYGGDIPEGHYAYFMRSDADQVIDGAAQAAGRTLGSEQPSGRNLAIATSCISRRWYLAKRTPEELDASFSVMPPRTRQVGFYSYGELCSTSLGRTDLQNQTMSVFRVEENVD